MVIDILTAAALAAQCAPSVAPQTLLSVVRVESGFDPLVIGVNGRPHVQLHPASTADAIAAAERYMARGASIDLGLGQINSRNLSSLGLSVADAFDPCLNLAAAAQMIVAGYQRSTPQPGLEQAALRTSFSFYNTGDPVRGFRNGYVAKVTAAAREVVPALDVAAGAGAGAAASPSPLATPPTPAWDVFARSAESSQGFVIQPQSPGDSQ